MRRQIIFSRSFESDVEEFGGYRSIDKAISTIEDHLVANPYAFPLFENDFIRFRYALTKRIDDLPPIAIQFTIAEDGNVHLERIFDATP